MNEPLTPLAEQSLVVTQLRAFMEWLGPGRKLTQTGRITLADARQLVALLETGDEIDPVIGERVFRTVSSEELHGLGLVLRWAQAARLVRTANGRLLPVKKSAVLLEQPLALWERAFEVIGSLGEALCATEWDTSPLGPEFEPVMTAMLSRLYARPVPLADLRALSWELATRPYAVEQAPEQHQQTWRRLNDRDTERALAALAALGAVRHGDDEVALTPLGLHGMCRMLGEAETGDPVHQVAVTLLGTDPPVWRRLLVSSGVRLDRLHRTIQAAMGWEDYHLHAFSAGVRRYGDVDGDADEHEVTLADLVDRPRTRIDYTYDFGDDWRHEIVVEQVAVAEEGVRYPVFLDGAGACPPEDCGGIGGYQRLREVLSDPTHPEHEELAQWAGLEKAADFDPSSFDGEQIARNVAEVS